MKTTNCYKPSKEARKRPSTAFSESTIPCVARMQPLRESRRRQGAGRGRHRLAVGHRQDLRIETSLSSYLLKSVQNRALNLRQQQERKAHADTRYYEKMEEMIRDSVDELHYRELSALVKRAIDDLPSEYREVFVRHRFGGRKYKEIADELGVTVPIVAYRIQQTTRLLQQKIGPIVQMTAPAFLCQMLLNHT